MRYLLLVQVLFLALPFVAFGKVTQERVNVRLVTDEAEAVLTILAKKKANAADFDFATDGFRAPTRDFIDGIEYDGRQPNAYIEKLGLGLKGQQKVEGGNVVGK